MPSDSSQAASRVSGGDGTLAVVLLAVAAIGIVASVLAVADGEPVEAHVWPIAAATVTGVLAGWQLLRVVVHSGRAASVSSR